MKNQALTTTLAILLAVSLSALVALIVSTEVVGDQAAADTPTPINIGVVSPEAPAPAAPAADEDASPFTPGTGTVADDTIIDDTPAPATDDEPAHTDDEAAPTDDEPAPGDDTNDDDTNDDEPSTGEPPCEGEIVDGECVPPILILCTLGYELIDGECVLTGCPVTHTLQDGVCKPLVFQPPCAGEIVDGECVPPILILCTLGYELIDGECVFTGCPVTHSFQDGICKPLVFEAPCLAGFHRIDGECVPNTVVFPGQFDPLCFVGQHVENGVCVDDYKVNPGLVVPGLELATNG